MRPRSVTGLAFPVKPGVGSFLDTAPKELRFTLASKRLFRDAPVVKKTRADAASLSAVYRRSPAAAWAEGQGSRSSVGEGSGAPNFARP
jgi:hypothetical protein